MARGNYSLFLTFELMTLVHSFAPEIQMPYKAIPGTSTVEINKIGSTLTCDEQRNSLEDCATECFERSKTTTGCPGFYTDTTQSNVCHLCIIRSESQNRYEPTNDHILYLLRYKARKPTPEVSMDFDNYTEAEIYGVNVVGTPAGVQPTDHTPGIKDAGLYLHDGGKVRLTGSETECWTNLIHCASGMTVSIWVKPNVIEKMSVVSAGDPQHIAFRIHITNSGLSTFNVYIGINKHQTKSTSPVFSNEWNLLAGLFDTRNNETLVYLNGVNSTNYDLQENAVLEADWGGHIGVKHASPYTDKPLDGYVDEFKYYYRVLDSKEIWREYVGYDLDLELQSVIPSPDLVSNGNEFVDDNLATCVELSKSLSYNSFKIKLWNSASDKTNFTATVVTENLECRHKGFSGLMVYGNQHDLPTAVGLKNADKMHFLGHFSMMALESKSENSNGQNECVFKHIREDIMSYYIFLSVQNVQNEGPLKICEVQCN